MITETTAVVSSLSVCKPRKSNISALHPHTRHTEDGTKPIQPGACVKSTPLLTQVVSHPVLWHRIEPTSLGCTLSPHRHRDKPLMSLHLRLRPTRVGSESKNKRSEPDNSGSDRSMVGVMGLELICTCPACVVSESTGT